MTYDLVVRNGSGGARREFELDEEVAVSLWVHSEAAQPGCSLDRR